MSGDHPGSWPCRTSDIGVRTKCRQGTNMGAKAVPDYVLVVDDDALFRAYVRSVLEESGYRVVDAEDGFAALAAMRASRPAAVVLDVNMPRLSGYEVCRAIREEHGPDLPMIFVSGERTESFDRVAGLTIGADDYLGKPCRGRRAARPAPVSAPPGAGGLRDVDADPSRAGGAPAACERSGSGRDRRAARDQPEDGREPHRASPLQARGTQPGGGGRARLPSRESCPFGNSPDHGLVPLTLTTAGESHGPALVAILRACPRGSSSTAAAIDADLRRRQEGYGRSPRQQIEQDQVEVLAGCGTGGRSGRRSRSSFGTATTRTGSGG